MSSGRRMRRLAVLSVLLLCGCGATPVTPATVAAHRAFLYTVHQQDPTVNRLRSDTQLLRLGAAACAGFASGVSFYSLADTMAVNDGGLPPSDLGTVISAAADNLCTAYRSRVN